VVTEKFIYKIFKVRRKFPTRLLNIFGGSEKHYTNF